MRVNDGSKQCQFLDVELWLLKHGAVTLQFGINVKNSDGLQQKQM